MTTIMTIIVTMTTIMTTIVIMTNMASGSIAIAINTDVCISDHVDIFCTLRKMISTLRISQCYYLSTSHPDGMLGIFPKEGTCSMFKSSSWLPGLSV